MECGNIKSVLLGSKMVSLLKRHFEQLFLNQSHCTTDFPVMIKTVCKEKYSQLQCKAVYARRKIVIIIIISWYLWKIVGSLLKHNSELQPLSFFNKNISNICKCFVGKNMKYYQERIFFWWPFISTFSTADIYTRPRSFTIDRRCSFIL